MITKRITPAKTVPSAHNNQTTTPAAKGGLVRNGPTSRLWIRCAHHKKPRPTTLFALGVAVLISFLCAASPVSAQESQLDKGPAPPYAEPAPEPKPAEPTYDPLRADKSVEIGTFYLKRGNYDAAIERFQDATHFQPKLARPYELLGEAFERKGDVDKALASYKKYLDVYRNAPDREKILKRIEKLEGQSGARSQKRNQGRPSKKADPSPYPSTCKDGTCRGPGKSALMKT